jgi:uncharacterized protein YigA (DUF484 family)
VSRDNFYLFSASTELTKGDRLHGLAEKLNNLGDDAQLAREELQEILHKQQQTLKRLSNFSKMLHDVAKSVIRKISGC